MPRPKRQWDLLVDPVCKYCQRRFINNLPRYRSHIRNHELNIKPYWYANPNLPPKAKCVEFKTFKQRKQCKLMSVQKNTSTEVKKQQDKPKSIDTTKGRSEVQLKEPGVSAMQCKFCHKHFSTVKTKTAHERKHRTKKSYACKVCGQQFQHKSVLISHKVKHKTTEGKFTSTFCDEQSVAVSAKIVHEMSHTGGKLHKCSYCSKSFLQSSSKKNHEMTHTGEKPHTCNFCSKSFSQLGTKKRHEMTHTGEKSHKCSFCSKYFIQLYVKKQHEMTHTGEKLSQM